jgi:hypothetical protein
VSTDAGHPESPMTDERPMGVLDEPNEGRTLHATLGGVVYARHPVRTHLVTATDDAPRWSWPLRRRVGTTCGSWPSASAWWRSPRAAPTRSPRSAGPPGPAAPALRDASRIRHRPGFGGDDGAGDPRGRRPAHPARRRRLGGDEAVRHPRRLLPHRRAAGEGDRRPDQLHHPAVQPGRDARARRIPTAPRRIAGGGSAPGGGHRCERRRLRRARRQPRRRPALRPALFADNPLGQAREQTPICLVREVAWPAGGTAPARAASTPHPALRAATAGRLRGATMAVTWGCSSAGRAPPLQGGGQGFESPHLHQISLFPSSNRCANLSTRTKQPVPSGALRGSLTAPDRGDTVTVTRLSRGDRQVVLAIVVTSPHEGLLTVRATHRRAHRSADDR